MIGFFDLLKDVLALAGYLSEGRALPKPLKPEEEAQYLMQYFNGDESARKVLIERNMRLVVHITKKYDNTRFENDDLISIGTIGLIKGINTYSADKGTQLATYCARCIENGFITQRLINVAKILMANVSMFLINSAICW